MHECDCIGEALMERHNHIAVGWIDVLHAFDIQLETEDVATVRVHQRPTT